MYIITFSSVMRSEVAAHLGLVNIHTLDRSTLAQGEGMITPINYICKKKMYVLRFKKSGDSHYCMKLGSCKATQHRRQDVLLHKEQH